MTGSLLLLALALTGLFLTILALRYLESGRLASTRRSYRLQFPRELPAASVVAFLRGLSGLRAPWWRRVIVVPAMVLEVSATETGIAHHLIIPESLIAIVVAHLRAALPGVRLTRDKEHLAMRPTLAVEFALSAQHRPVRTDQIEASSAAILASLQPLRADERAVVQWVISPGSLPAPAHRESTAEGKRPVWLTPLLPPRGPSDAEVLRAERDKQAEPLFWAAGRLGVVTPHPARARHLLRRLLGAFHMVNVPGAALHARGLPDRLVRPRVTKRSVPLLIWPALLNAAELAGLVGIPAGAPELAGLSLGACRHLPPPPELPSEGFVIARATYPGAERRLAIGAEDRLHHCHVVGPTGGGKSTLLLNLITQELANGYGLIVIDPKGDLVSDVMARVPGERVRDVIVLDPNDALRPVGFNLLKGASSAPELMVDQVVGIFHKLYANFWGPRTDDILRASLLTLVADPAMTICEVPLLLTDENFRRRLVGAVDDPIALEPFWGWYDSLSRAERAAAIGPVLNKLRTLLLRRRLRNTLGQADGSVDFGRVLVERKVLLVSLAKGLLGEEASALLGSLVLARLWQAVQQRAGMARAQRHPVFLHIDEVQDFLNLPISVGDMLAQARALGLGVTAAHQHLGQLPTETRQDLLANARTKVVYQVTADDARVLAREFVPHLAPADLQGLGPYEVAIKPCVNGRVTAPVTGMTLAPPPLTHHGQAVRAWSRSRYGHDRDAVERAIRARHGQRAGAGPIGQLPRRDGRGRRTA